MGTKSLHSVVCVGGGTGLACLLKGLKHGVFESPARDDRTSNSWISRLTAVVTVTDDGGSSGRLREELKVLPPGDIRNCMVALSTDESLMAHLFQYRFQGSGHLRGHSFGNLFLTALTEITGDFLKAIRVSSDVLSTRGRIYPSTLQDVRLEASLADGSRVVGQSAIISRNERILSISLSPRNCRPVEAVLKAIRTADIITVGPGSLYTSLLPNLLVKGISREIRKSPALKIYICNLMTQPGETTGLTASEHIAALCRHAGDQFFDGIILNNKPIASSVLGRYRRQGALPVVGDYDRIREMGLEIYTSDFLAQAKVVRHDPKLLAEGVRDAFLLWRGENRNSQEGAIPVSI